MLVTSIPPPHSSHSFGPSWAPSFTTSNTQSPAQTSSSLLRSWAGLVLLGARAPAHKEVSAGYKGRLQGGHVDLQCPSPRATIPCIAFAQAVLPLCFSIERHRILKQIFNSEFQNMFLGKQSQQSTAGTGTLPH